MIQGSLQWLSPIYSLLPIGLAVISILLILFKKQIFSLDIRLFANNLTFKHPLSALIPSKQVATQHQGLSITLFFWLWTMLAFTVAQPVRIGEKLPDLPPERDIVLLVDVSISMTLKDYRDNDKEVNRLAVLKRLLNDFSEASKGERLAMIVFAEKPYLLVPLTRDQKLIEAQLQRLNSTLAGRVSALGDAITLGLKEAKKQPQRKQIFVVFTDTNDAIGRVTPSAAATLAAEANIPIYTIAIGSIAKKRDDINDGLLYQAVNVKLLQALSKKTGGKIYIANETQAIETALKDIQKRQKNTAKQHARYTHEPLYFWFLLAGILPLILWQSRHLVQRASRK